MVSKRMRREGVYVVLLLLVGIAGLFFYLLFKHTPLPSASFAEQETYWRERIREVGEAAAYKELATSVQGMEFGFQHRRAHVFGDALYSEVGLSGATVCDWPLHGCMHQFMGRAVADHGVSAVALLDRYCKGDIPCQHGIGHGVLSALGYTFFDLEKTLALCHTLSDYNPLFACGRGVFMEYNHRSMLQDFNDTRPLDGDWLAPCNRFSGDDARTCYFIQPTWWAALWFEASQTQAEATLSETAYRHMAALCHSLSDKTFMYACIAGTGFTATLKRSADQAVHLCDAMYADADELLLCRVNVALMFSWTDSRSAAIDVCQGLSDEAHLYCMGYVSGKVSQPYLISPPVRL